MENAIWGEELESLGFIVIKKRGEIVGRLWFFLFFIKPDEVWVFGRDKTKNKQNYYMINAVA